MYECRCCCITICTVCICEAQLKMTGLAKIDSGPKPAEPVQRRPSLPTATTGQPASEPVVAIRMPSMAVRVKRKPIPGIAGSTTSPVAQSVSQETYASKGMTSQPPSPAMPYAPEAAQRPIVQYPQSGYQPLPAPTAADSVERVVPAQATHQSGKPVDSFHAPTEPILQSPQLDSSKLNQEPLQGFPQLQQVHTAPAITNFGEGFYLSQEKRPKYRRSAYSHPISFSRIKTKHPTTFNNIRRASHASVKTAKKLSHNPWVRAGVRISAKYALNAVIGDVAADLMLGNVGSGAINVPSGLFSNNNNCSSPTVLTSGLFSNSSSSNLPDLGTTFSDSSTYGGTIGGCSPPLSPATPSLVDQAPGFTTTPDNSSIDASFLAQSQYSADQNEYTTSYDNTLQGGQDAILESNNSLQQFQNVQLNIEYNQNMLLNEVTESNVQVSQMFSS